MLVVAAVMRQSTSLQPPLEGWLVARAAWLKAHDCCAVSSAWRKNIKSTASRSCPLPIPFQSAWSLEEHSWVRTATPMADLLTAGSERNLYSQSFLILLLGRKLKSEDSIEGPNGCNANTARDLAGHVPLMSRHRSA